MADASTSVVRCRGVTRSFGSGAARVMALRGVDLDVEGGELMMLVGPSGCGKTTPTAATAGSSTMIWRRSAKPRRPPFAATASASSSRPTT